MPVEVPYIRFMVIYTTLLTDNFAFWLHNKLAIFALMWFAVILSVSYFYKDPLVCSSGEDLTDTSKARCWFVSSFNTPGQEKPVLGSQLYNIDDYVQFYRYYLWPCFILLLQASFFYVPGYLWKRWEGGLVHKVMDDLETEDVTGDYRRLVANSLFQKFYTLNPYVYRFIFCELLNLVNIIGQIYLLDYFMEGSFRKHGVNLLWFIFTEEPVYRNDSLNRAFPKLAKCMFNITWQPGVFKWSEVFCLMTLNMVSEKLFVYLLILYVLVAVFTLYYSYYRILSFFSPSYRLWLLKHRSELTSEEMVEAIFKKCKYGSWFVLCQLSKNIEPETFNQLLTELMRKLYE